jgi:hypothetical protein
MVKVKPQPWSHRIKRYAVKAYHTTKDVLGAIDDGVAAFKTVHDIVSPTLVRQQDMSPETKMRIDAKTNDYDSIKRKVQATHNAGKALLRYAGEH